MIFPCGELSEAINKAHHQHFIQNKSSKHKLMSMEYSISATKLISVQHITAYICLLIIRLITHKVKVCQLFLL